MAGAFGYWRESGRFVLFEAPAVILATGGIGKSFKVTSNSWEYTGDGHALALRTGAGLVNMEFVQFHPTGMVWPPSVKGILVTESVRGDGGVLRNSEGKRFMFDYVPEVFRGQYADTEDEADRWYDDPENNLRPPELLPRDEVARAINTEVKEGRGSPHGGVFLDVSTRLPAEEIRRRLPSMHHQFKELADVDITAEPMEVGPTCHYVMGGCRGRPRHRRPRRCPGCSRPARSPVACTAPTGSAATRCPTCWSSAGGPERARRPTSPVLGDQRPVGRRRGRQRRGGGGAGPVRRRTPGENPYTLHQELQQTMNDLVGIIRREGEIQEALEPRSTTFRERLAQPQRRGPPAVQPRLAPGAGPAQHAAGLRVRRAGGAGAAGEPRRAHARGLPRHGPDLARRQPRLPAA